MARRAWGIKLGSAGREVPFCERHHIVGVGWRWVDDEAVARMSREDLFKHIRDLAKDRGPDDQNIGSAVGQLYRFGQECAVGDYILYYDPAQKRVSVVEVASPSRPRSDLRDDAEANIGHYREVRYAREPVSVLDDLPASIKGGLLSPRMTFWNLDRTLPDIDTYITTGTFWPLDPLIHEAYVNLRNLLVTKACGLPFEDWEWLVVDWLRAQGVLLRAP